MAPSTQCETTRQLLDDWVLGDLDERQAAAVSGHLANCPACREKGEHTRRLVEDLKSDFNRRAPTLDPALRERILSYASVNRTAENNRRRRWLRYGLISAAAVLMVFLIAQIVLPSRGNVARSPMEVSNQETIDWPGFRGPNQDGTSSETGWSAKWDVDGPRISWKAEVGDGLSGISVANQRAYTMGNRGEQDTVYCFDIETGEVIWKHSYPCAAGEVSGPRSTPTIDGAVVYTLSRKGHLHALDAITGTVHWQKNLQKELNLDLPRWDFASSVQIEKDLLILNLGTAGTAVNKHNGTVVWNSGTGPAGYATPVKFNIDGKQGLMVFSAEGLTALETHTGNRLWHYPWKTKNNIHAVDPIIQGDHVFISSGYDTGGVVLQYSSRDARPLWAKKVMRNHYSNSVLYDGYLYGFDENILKCVDFATGKEQWAQPGLGKSSLIIVDGKLIIQTKFGTLVTAAASPLGYQEIARAKILPGMCMTSPSFSGGRVYTRSHGGVLACVDLRQDDEKN